jgi:hypothetical protein
MVTERMRRFREQNTAVSKELHALGGVVGKVLPHFPVTLHPHAARHRVL